MMEVAVHPGYATNGWIYLGFADPAAAGGPTDCMTAVVRGRINNGKWTDQEWIYRARPEFYGGSGVHFGTRFVFDKGFLFFVVGERGGMMRVQDIQRPEGKIFRPHDDLFCYQDAFTPYCPAPLWPPCPGAAVCLEAGDGLNHTLRKKTGSLCPCNSKGPVATSGPLPIFGFGKGVRS